MPSETIPSESTIWDSGRSETPDLRFVHFNDVYNVSESSAEPVGGISRFVTIAKSYRDDVKYKGQPRLLTLFSGDAYNPSLESSVTKGRHMVSVLNTIGTDIACVGNHDLDFGVKQFRHLRESCTFPWLLANVLDPALGEDEPLANCLKTLILTSSNGIKVGIIGLGEREWLATINHLPPNLIYRSASETAKALIPGLRAQGCEMIIALTHAREPNDMKLADNTPEGLIDLIACGHDHFYSHKVVKKTHIIRSGTDFKQLSYIEAWRASPGKRFAWDFDITRRDIVRSISEDPETVKLVEGLTSSLRRKLEKSVGHTAVPLDSRFTTVRTKESNLGNWVCDLMRHFHSADCALMAAGTIRGDQIYPPGSILMKDIMNCFPFEDPVVVLRLSGKAIWEALENSVCLYPALEGRFPQVSNIQMCFDPSAPAHNRVVDLQIGGESVDRDSNRVFTLATRGYMARGKDGFDSLLCKSEGGIAEEVVSEENGMLISTIIRQYFMSLRVFGKWRRWGHSLDRHWGGVHKQLHEGNKIRSAKASPERQRAAKHSRSGSVIQPTLSERKTSTCDGSLVDSDTDDEDHVDSQDSGVPPVRQNNDVDDSQPWEQQECSKKRVIAMIRHWKSKAGIDRPSDAVEGQGDEDMPHWTQAIAPKLEGRIVIKDTVA